MKRLIALLLALLLAVRLAGAAEPDIAQYDPHKGIGILTPWNHTPPGAVRMLPPPEVQRAMDAIRFTNAVNSADKNRPTISDTVPVCVDPANYRDPKAWRLVEAVQYFWEPMPNGDYRLTQSWSRQAAKWRIALNATGDYVQLLSFEGDTVSVASHFPKDAVFGRVLRVDGNLAVRVFDERSAGSHVTIHTGDGGAARPDLTPRIEVGGKFVVERPEGPALKVVYKGVKYVLPLVREDW